LLKIELFPPEADFKRLGAFYFRPLFLYILQAIVEWECHCGAGIMPKIAKVVVDIGLDKEFDYIIPENLENILKIGSRVIVSFGRRETTGYAVGFADSSEHGKLKKIIALAEEKPFIDGKMLKLAQWMSDYYCAPVERAIRAMLPAAVRRKGARFKKQKFVFLSENTEQELGKKQSALKKLPPKQKTALEFMHSRANVSLAELTHELGITAAPVRALEKKGLVRIASAPIARDPLANRTILPTEPLNLMQEQANALALIKKCIERLKVESNPPFRVRRACAAARQAGTRTGRQSAIHNPSVVLLHGVTGSGKTEVYLQAIDYVLEKGKGAIVLVPEISLTPQTVERFAGRFGKRVAVLHSYLSEGERHDEWHRIREGKADIVIGARSAVFAPLRNPGLIVVDEEHEPSYKQEDAPRYNARDIAVMRGRLDNCAVVLGTATPSLESWHNTEIGKYQLTALPKRVDNKKMPVMRIIDMRIETERTGHASVFSKDLLEAIRLRLNNAEQTILFLNRRGYATSLICPKCGYIAKCDQCSVAYTYHRKDEKLCCHICGGIRKVPERCPACHDPAFKFTGIGTQRVETIANKLFPHAHIQRIDTDVTARKGSYRKILGDFRAGKTDILIGTQMIAKGLHFPNVTLVGVVYADLSLHMPDFRAGERTFQLLSQVAGRAGRGETRGEVIVQTYTPFNPAIQAARKLDCKGFFDQETKFRMELKYPPFTHLICVTLEGPSDRKVSFSSANLAEKLKRRLEGKAIISDAVPAPLAKAKGMFRYQIMLRCRSVRTMTDPLKEILRDFKPLPKITIAVDVDAISLL